ncbi:hydroxymethylglutaryl-CoA synthase [Candidatus Dependentiae bacterium]|nr:hydroxymethylglutaryl-CoA synthase [Candidatus Dependentiae bacterium]
MIVGIVGYGIYVPKRRVSVTEPFATRLGIKTRSVPGSDEDAATIAVAAVKQALASSSIEKENIGALYVGSESHPYAVKPTSTIITSALDFSEDLMTADLEFACKGGTAAIQLCYGLVKASMTGYALAVGADTAQAKQGDVLEHSASAAGAAFLIGAVEQELLATIDAMVSITTNTPDFWRRNLQPYPEHTNRFTGEPSYFKHVMCAAQKIMDKTGLNPEDFSYVVFHQPNGKFPKQVAKRLGFTMEQLKPGLVVELVGNSYSACSLLGLAAVLDCARPEQKILLVSYGSGSGSDAFVLTVKRKQR